MAGEFSITLPANSSKTSRERGDLGSAGHTLLLSGRHTHRRGHEIRCVQFVGDKKVVMTEGNQVRVLKDSKYFCYRVTPHLSRDSSSFTALPFLLSLAKLTNVALY